MAKIHQHISRSLIFGLLLQVCHLASSAQKEYRLLITPVDQTEKFIRNSFEVPETFSSKELCELFLNRLPAQMYSKGYITASVDTVVYDTAFASATIFVGAVYRWKTLSAGSTDPQLLEAVGWRKNNYEGKPFDGDKTTQLQKRILDYLENNGYPFAKVYFKGMEIGADSVSAELMVEKGPFYKIDSIRVYGEAKISNTFLQRYLDIPNGTTFSRKKLEGITGKIQELSYLQQEAPYDLSLLGTGSVLNLHLKPKKSSQFNFLIGFLPQTNNDLTASKKLLVTGEANIRLNNALGTGETFGLNWQQIQQKSPRLNILYKHPYIFNSSYGLDMSFDMFRKDSSFLNVKMQLGTTYSISQYRTGKVFFQRFQTIVSEGGINTSAVIQSRRLPDVADISSSNIGLEYDVNTSDYRNNPRRGFLFNITGTAGTKNIKKNNQILELKDPSDPGYDFGSLYDTVKLNSYQFRITAGVSRYSRLAGQGVLKTSVSAGLFQSESIFRNELFQIGGFKLLRGFDEESQYVSQYAIATLEYRYLVGQNSYFYLFTDGGWAANKSTKDFNHTYISTGLGMAFETKAGIFNLAWAVGKRDDLTFNLRQSKVHIGFVNYF